MPRGKARAPAFQPGDTRYSHRTVSESTPAAPQYTTALVREKLEELARQLSKPVAIPPSADPTPTRPSGTGKKATEEAALPSEYYEYTMKEGDILSVVISEYNQSQGLKVRLAQVIKANPNIKDPNRIPVGTKLRIPIIK